MRFDMPVRINHETAYYYLNDRGGMLASHRWQTAKRCSTAALVAATQVDKQVRWAS